MIITKDKAFSLQN